MGKPMYVYVMTNANRTVLYTGVTNDLVRRVQEHRSGGVAGFTSRYGAARLVYYEEHESAQGAIAREKQIKAGSRARKEALIEGRNPRWVDLAAGWFEE